MTCDSKKIVKEHKVLIRAQEGEVYSDGDENKEYWNVVPSVGKPHTPHDLVKQIEKKKKLAYMFI